MSEKEILRVMTIFDESEEAESLIKVLRNSGEVVRDIRVEDAEDMETALVDNPIDVILAKQKLHTFSALQALEVLAKSGRDIPLIVITPSRQSSPVTDELKAGGRDVVNVDQADRLLHVVKREVGDLKNRKNLRRAEQMLHESEKRARQLIDSSRDAISYVHDGMHIYANQSYLEMFGYESLEDVEGMPILDMVSKDDHAKLKQFLRDYAKGIGKDNTLDIAVMRTDGEAFQTMMEFSPASMEGEACTQIIIRDRAGSKELEQQLNVLSKQDLLTGLFNRTYFLDQVDKLIAQAVEGNAQGALLFIEIDDFEGIRNTIGITSADKLLSEVAALFKKNLGNHGILARFEGAMFTMLVNNADMDQAEKIASAIVKLVNEFRTTIGGKVVTPKVSIGLTHINETVSNLQDCINRAEKGCEIALKEGGNRYYIYNPAMEELEEEQRYSVWARRIKEALRNNQFQSLYQPIVSLHGIAGGTYEVLVRMLDETGAEVSPGEFLPAAEKADLTKFIDRWVIANTFQVLQERVSNGEDIRFFIKVSRGTLLDAEFMPWLSERINNLNLDTSKIIFELDEATALNHLSQSKVLVDSFKQLKCGTALENVGLEQNTFQSFKELPVDFIKIHAKLIAKLPQNMENQEKVKEISNQARAHNMQTIAAYVEDASSLAVLWQCSVDFIQGHFLQQPTTELNFEFENAF